MVAPTQMQRTRDLGDRLAHGELAAPQAQPEPVPVAIVTPAPSLHARPRLWGGAVACAAISTALAAVLVFGAWPHLERASWWGPSADVLYIATVVKSLVTGQFLPFQAHDNANLGFPFGLQGADFPITWVFHLLLMKLIALLSHDPFTIVSAYFLLTFTLTAPAFYGLAVSLGVTRTVALGFGIIYAFIPFHLHRFAHLFLAAHFTIAFATLLCAWLWQPRPLFGRGSGARGWVAGAVGWMLGCGGIYYAFFSCMFFALCALIAALTRRTRAPLGSALVLCSLVAASLLTTLAPTLAYRREHGPNTVALYRGTGDVELYALRLGSIVLPPADHRIPWLAALGRAYEAGVPPRFEGQGIEYIGATALLGLLFSAAVAWRRRGSELGIETLIALLALVSILYASSGGGASIIARLITPEIRSVNRISPFIACFGVLGAALHVDRRLANMRASVRVAVVAALVSVALLDQVPVVPAYPAPEPTYAADTRSFYARVQAALPAGAAVLQLPYRPFPERSGLLEMFDHAHLEAFILTNGLRFSHGTMSGRNPALIMERFSRSPLNLRRLRNQGFSAILIDRRGFPDHGAALERELQTSGLSKLVDTPLGHRALYQL